MMFGLLPCSPGWEGRFLDNIFVERLWRSLKYDCACPYAWNGGSDARARPNA
jgi:hypothetical protein